MHNWGFHLGNRLGHHLGHHSVNYSLMEVKWVQEMLVVGLSQGSSELNWWAPAMSALSRWAQESQRWCSDLLGWPWFESPLTLMVNQSLMRLLQPQLE